MTAKQLAEERMGNQGRREWVARPQSVADHQKMLDGAIRTIERLLDIIAKGQQT